MMDKRCFLVLYAGLMVCLIRGTPGLLYAEVQAEPYAEVYLKNKDRISGKVVLEDDAQIKIDHEVLGAISIKKESIENIVFDKGIKPAQTPTKEAYPWSREFSIGYDKSSGNTENSHLSVNLIGNKKTDTDEFTVKADVFYSSANKKMDAQKWYGMVRYAYSFWGKKWYNFYKFESDHDRFANIDYRIIPSLGLGYWFDDTPTWKAMAEVGVGLEHTRFRDNTKDSNEPILIPRAFFEKTLFGSSRISQDIVFYPSLKETGEYRMHSETALINPINEKLSLRLSFIDDYNSDAAGDTKKNDTRFISSLAYSF
ncbi:MAG: hypothetical protein AMJ95_10755 [Omnitrophica WOR_2 bacterium SM23_72]|nr:MAG: hypothetical protein AMJ95_10755 [Omnitrophica WOR_2 bacterium SM23_72]